uniref:Copper transport protein n=1 Tax=Elaeophora elaphi TaxID=1147741 RepID=A0A0R3RPL0_9BILA
MFFLNNIIRMISSNPDDEVSNGRNKSLSMMNPMVLHFGNHEFILVNFWKIGTVLGLSSSVLIVFLLSVLYEAVKALRRYFARNRAIERRNQRIQSNFIVRESSEHVDSVSTEMDSYSPVLGFSGQVCSFICSKKSKTTKILRAVKQLFTFYRVVQSSLYFTQILLAYTLMLIAMTFNVWIILGIVIGEAIGYFLFSEEPTSDESIETTC